VEMSYVVGQGSKGGRDREEKGHEGCRHTHQKTRRRESRGDAQTSSVQTGCSTESSGGGGGKLAVLLSRAAECKGVGGAGGELALPALIPAKAC
jgi:hypothetical protein